MTNPFLSRRQMLTRCGVGMGLVGLTQLLGDSRLLAAARPDARLIVLPRVGHEIAWNPAAQQAILAWLAALPAS